MKTKLTLVLAVFTLGALAFGAADRQLEGKSIRVGPTGGVLTLPNATDTLVGKATTDTLTNKTISAGTLTGNTTLPDSGRLDSSGNLGLGRAATTRLDVYQSQNGSTTVNVENPSIASGASTKVILTTGATNGAFIQKASSANTSSYAAAGGSFDLINADNSELNIGTNNLTRIRVAADGKVGVGKTPSGEFDVSKAQNGSTAVNIENTNTGAGASAKITFAAGASNGALIQKAATANTTTYGAAAGSMDIINSDNTELNLGTNNTSRLRISNGGTVSVLGLSTAGPVLTSAAGALSSEAQLAISRGGTGQATATAAFDALAPTVQFGDIIYHDGSDNVRLGGNNTATKKYLRTYGGGGSVTNFEWAQIDYADLTGTPPSTSMPQLTGDVTTPSAGSDVTTVAQIQGTTVSGTTGTGNVVFSASPTLTGTISAANATLTGTMKAVTQSLIGGTTADTVGTNSISQILGTTAASASQAVRRYSNDANGGSLIFTKSRNGSLTGLTVLNSGDNLGTILFRGVGTDAAAYSTGASIEGYINAAPGSAIIPGRLDLSTSNGSGVLTTAISIDENQVASFSAAPKLSALSASLPLKLDASKNMTAAAIDLSGSEVTGTMAAARLPALTGDVTTSAGSVATTVAKIQTTTVSGTTGTGNVVFSAAPTLTGTTVLAGVSQSGQYTNTANGGTVTPVLRLTGSWFSGGTSTTTKPQMLIETSGATTNNWSTSGTGFGINAASGFAGRLIDAQLNGTNRFRVGATGNLSVDGASGTGAGAVTVTHGTDTPAQAGLFSFNGSATGVLFNGDLSGGISSGSNGAATAVRVGMATSTSRSISAAGTINASGADYAEYMRKARAEDIFEKGELLGIDANGELTKKFSESIHFMIKSTAPSYIGGDNWSPAELPDEAREDYEIRLATEQAKVEIVAYTGQVPCLIPTDGVSPGDWIVPSQGDNDSIVATAVSQEALTFGQFKAAVGKVFKIMDANKALVAVGVK
jgi:hypothetical protein